MPWREEVVAAVAVALAAAVVEVAVAVVENEAAYRFGRIEEEEDERRWYPPPVYLEELAECS